MRAKNVAKNSFLSVLSQVLIIFAGFFSQRVINVRLGTELVGLNGVISNVIMVFSVSELGLSTAIVFHLYQAISVGDEREIAGLMNLYRKAYSAVAGFMALIGILFLPFVHCLMRENHFQVSYVRLIYGLWLIRTVLGYLLSYKRSILIADQREYIVSLATLAVSLFQYLSVIALVLLFDNYVLALCLSIAFEVLINVRLILYVDRKYPFLKQHADAALEKKTRGRIFADVRNLFVTRIAQKILCSTDNLIMSVFISLSMVGLYSNYCLITQSLINIMQALSNALQPTIGNLVVEQNRERDEELLQCFTQAFFLFSSVIMCGVLGMASYFVSDVWLGREFVLTEGTVFLCAFNCALYVMLLPISMFTSVSGLFLQEKWVSFGAALMNLGVSLVLVRSLGVQGVLIGTTCAYLVLLMGKTYFYYEQYLGKSMWWYLGRMALYFVLALVEALLGHMAVERIYLYGRPIRFILATAICGILPIACNLLLLGKSRTMRNTVTFVQNYRRFSKGEHREER